MIPLRVLRSAAFRLALVFAAVFAVGAVALVATFDRAVKLYAERSTLSALREEAALLRIKASSLGTGGLRAFIEHREQAAAAEHDRYLLLDAQGHRLAGALPLGVAKIGLGSINLPEGAEPDDPPDPGDEPEQETSTVRTMGFRLVDGSLVVVGRDAYALNDLTRWVDWVTIWSGCGIALLALIGGYLISAVFVARLERVNAAARMIMAGRLNERLPTIGMGDEFNRLSANLNLMLDRIETLMTGLRQVSTDIAHDLRTPLTRLRQTLEAMRSSADAEAYEQSHEQALAQLDQVLATFNALLRIGLIEGGTGRARFADVDLSEVMERVWRAYQPAAEDACRRLTADIQSGVHVIGDAELLAQMFVNLVENGLAHSGPKAAIHLRLAACGGEAAAEVIDNGPGIPPEERDKVIRRFYRLEASRTTPGAGLGLALVAAIADLHHVSFSLNDNAPGVRARLVYKTLSSTHDESSSAGEP